VQLPVSVAEVQLKFEIVKLNVLSVCFQSRSVSSIIT